MSKKIICPSYLDDTAKKEWKRVVKILNDEDKDFDEKDLKVLEGYCSNYSNWLKFEKLAEDAGYIIFSPNGYPQQHPYCQLAKNSQTAYLGFAKELGLTPAARSRMNKNNKIVEEKKDKDEEEMDDLTS